ncbi:protein phosphatase 1 regulatory subunit 14A isoform X1 [Rhinatrema bivittatum]|uniref:protein phosphatase 1 regulatory subunit 14A isoform X1 n=1 Tax=Rhinatrema bivittatum TaxID=194408 RepID=UPI00112B27AA|nr:protein phosphatase 1 regulatory subunit 14A isoform X1 [Rhinatrema bivittatum]
MAANKLGRKVLNKFHSPSRGNDSSNQGIQKRQARVTVKYDRKELQKRLDVEKWIDERLEELYKGKEHEMPDEIDIDDLLDLESDEERTRKLQSMLSSCNDTEDFVKELILKLKGLQKQTLLKGNGLEHQEQRSREIKKHA